MSRGSDAATAVNPWLRNNGSTIVSQFVDTAAVLTLLCLTGVIEWSRFPALLENGFFLKVLVALADPPLFYLSVWFLCHQFRLEPGEEIPIQRSLA